MVKATSADLNGKQFHWAESKIVYTVKCRPDGDAVICYYKGQHLHTSFYTLEKIAHNLNSGGWQLITSSSKKYEL